jgi:hypothetical protein
LPRTPGRPRWHLLRLQQPRRLRLRSYRNRVRDAGPYNFVAADAPVLKISETGQVVNVHALIATGVNAEGCREILGIDVATGEDGAGWPAFWRSLSARGLSEVKLVTSDARAGLVAAISATVPGAAWQRSHYKGNPCIPLRSDPYTVRAVGRQASPPSRKGMA